MGLWPSRITTLLGEQKVLAMFVPKRQNLSPAPHTDGTPTTRKKNEMTDITTVTTQEELDAALAAGIIDLLIDRPDGATPLEIENKKVRLRGNSSAILSGNSSAILRGNSRATLWGNSRAILRDNSSAILSDNSSAILWGNSRATLSDNSSATLSGNSSATLWGNSRATLKKFTVAWKKSVDATITGTGHVIDMTAIDLSKREDWTKYTGALVDEDGQIHLYKAVDDNLESAYSKDKFAYTVGSIVEPEWWKDNNFCGNGIHLCPSPQHARDHFPDATRFLEVTCDAATFVPIDTSKIKTAQAYVLREVDICGTPLKEDK